MLKELKEILYLLLKRKSDKSRVLQSQASVLELAALRHENARRSIAAMQYLLGR